MEILIFNVFSKSKSKRVSSLRQAQVGGEGGTSTYPSRSFVPWIAIALGVFMCSANAANWYVRPNAAGAQTGSDWNDAWALSSIPWSNINPGDTIWLAGGSYPSLSVGASGTSGNPITINRVTSSDAVPVGAAGWNASFDAQVVFSSGISTASYIVLDGHKWAPPGLPTVYGIAVHAANGVTGVDAGSNSTIKNVQVTGPGNANLESAGNTTAETDGILMDGNNVLVSGCCLHFLDTGIKFWNSSNNCTVEYTTIIDISSNSSGVHPDLIYSSGGSSGVNSQTITVRYCFISNGVSEGCFFDFGSTGPVTFYGNLFVSSSVQTCDAIELKQGFTFGTFKLYNNTFVNWAKGVLVDPTGVIQSNSVVQNNLFYSTTDGFDNGSSPYITTQYNGFGGGSTAKGTNSTANAANPFVNAGVPAAIGNYSNWGIVPGSWPVGAGKDLGAPYDVDLNGNNIGSTIGAFAAAGSGKTIPPPQNLRVTSSQ